MPPNGSAVVLPVSLRDWFAGQYVVAQFDPHSEDGAAKLAKTAYMIADAMLAERERKRA